MKYILNIFSKTKLLLVALVVTGIFVSCVGDELFRDDLPGANSKADTVFPGANFSYASSSDDFRMINFTNLSTESLSFQWDFGNGNTSTEKDPTFTFEEGEGTYPVSLTATDGNGITGTTTIDVVVAEGPFQPIILEPGFEDDTLPEGGGDGRDSWRNNDLGGVIQITGSPVTFGDQGAKLPVPEGDRIGYQEITVDPDMNYDLSFWYTMLSGSSDPRLIVSVLGVTENGGTFTTLEDVADGTIASVTVTNDDEPSVYVQQKLSFNSGDNNTVAIFFTNGAVEARLDDFTIDIGAEGAVPPSVGFSSAQSEINFLEYAFTNSSTGAVSYEWDFGDGNTSTEESPTHVYAEANVYTVSLKATNEAGLSSTLEQTIEILAPVTADFTFEVDPDNYQTYNFMDASVGAVMLLWEFGDGFQFTGMNPSHTYAEDGIYTVTLTAYSITGNTDVATAQLTISQGFVVEILNGDFTDGTANWKPSSFTGSSTSAFNSSSDGDPVDYSGVDTGSKTRGAKYTSSTTMVGPLESLARTSSTRAAYQAITVEPNTQYELEFSHAVIGDGNAVYVEILDGWFSDGADAFISSTVNGPLARGVGNVANGKGSFTVVTDTFTSNASGQVSIWIYAITDADVWVDNIKVNAVN
ncbi:PKD domain-containing protein [Hyunsoonleella sp. SJ7]|uniref:PKD domain-containing protein n=1 Tax=Hyunsoonleella aquatilis TaxID=2762758 RepID=A0A923KGW1_9FLAO|nr:PKD domain-containing protein [Hyunsoonleella aquatilis]MBC3759171.1 PKD domain-containing protein [Hyunsoonleella aquatilis]